MSDLLSREAASLQLIDSFVAEMKKDEHNLVSFIPFVFIKIHIHLSTSLLQTKTNLHRRAILYTF